MIHLIASIIINLNAITDHRLHHSLTNIEQRQERPVPNLIHLHYSTCIPARDAVQSNLLGCGKPLETELSRTVVLEEYLGINPELRPALRKMLKNDRLPKAQPEVKPREIGPKFLQDPEDMLDLTKPSRTKATEERGRN